MRDRGFSHILPQMQGGTDHDLMRSFLDVAAAVLNTGKPGQVTFTVKVAPSSENSIAIDASVKTTIPVTKQATVLFMDLDGGVGVRDPRQCELSLLEENSK